MAKPFRGVINVDVTQLAPDWEPYTQPIAPEGTPNVLYIVLDGPRSTSAASRSSTWPPRCAWPSCATDSARERAG